MPLFRIMVSVIQKLERVLKEPFVGEDEGCSNEKMKLHLVDWWSKVVKKKRNKKKKKRKVVGHRRRSSGRNWTSPSKWWWRFSKENGALQRSDCKVVQKKRKEKRRGGLIGVSRNRQGLGDVVESRICGPFEKSASQAFIASMKRFHSVHCLRTHAYTNFATSYHGDLQCEVPGPSLANCHSISHSCMQWPHGHISTS